MESKGLTFRELSEAEYIAFAKDHGSSPEIGAIATYFDAKTKKQANADVHLYGLFGCGTVCAAACCVVVQHATIDTRVCKLDSIIVDSALRNHGLGKVIVSKILGSVLGAPQYRISSIFSHAVHPATVRILSKLSFSDPPPVGAPLISVHLDEARRDQFLAKCQRVADSDLNNLKLQCLLCQQGSPKARRWCRPADQPAGKKAVAAVPR